MSGSAPPLEFFNPIMLVILVLLYGCGTLLMREAKVRWGLQWSIIFLAISYGIIEEGLMVKSFFNPDWQDIDELSKYGEFLGVQWCWTIMLTIYHATISTLIPIAIMESLWPEYRNKALLGSRGLKLTFTGFILITILGMIFSGTEEDGKYISYHPNPLLLVFSFSIILALIWLAYNYRNGRVITGNMTLLSPLTFGIAGFLFQGLNLIVPNALADNNVSAVLAITLQLSLATIAILFMIFQLFHQDLSTRHLIALISGSVLFFLIFGTLAGFAQGMLAVGIVGLGLLIWWRKTVLKFQDRGIA